METRTQVNKEVDITAWYFPAKKRFQSYPKRMEYNNETFTFAEGLRFLIQKGQEAIQFFDMTDGASNYRLKFDERQHTWTLVSITGPRRALH